MPDSKSMKKLDYESLISPKKHTMSLNVVPQPQQNAAEYFNSVLDILKMKDSTHSYNAIAPMPGFKPNLNYGDAHSSSSFFNQQGAMQQDGYGAPAYTAAIQSMRTVEVNDVQDSYENSQPQIIDIPPSAMPIVINFRTSASQIQIHQSHDAGEPKEVQETSSQDEPHFLRHSVTKPVIQEVHEIILPYRRIIQEIRPVEEEIKTIVARGSQGKDGSGHHGGGGNLGPIGPQDLQQLHQSSLSFGSSVHGGAAIGGKLNSGLKGGKLPGYGNKLSTSNGSSSSASASSKGYKSS
ncbi:hypothetical protein NH340_JMT02156 [Sarcoptes scabiei]|nr:hypothetical protein NH340_JMT02156 [Sarcoptes scabiei]